MTTPKPSHPATVTESGVGPRYRGIEAWLPEMPQVPGYSLFERHEDADLYHITDPYEASRVRRVREACRSLKMSRDTYWPVTLPLVAAVASMHARGLLVRATVCEREADLCRAEIAGIDAALAECSLRCGGIGARESK